MKNKQFYGPCLALVAGLFIVSRTFAGEVSLTDLAKEATLNGSNRSAQAIQKLREAGPAGLDALFEVYSNQVARHTLGAVQFATHAVEGSQFATSNATDADWEKIRAAFDVVGQQRDCYVSKLFWFTDLEQAKAAVRETGKPILSLRLLGNLDEEYSCANSRFFRTTLYANTTVANYLRDHFVLHWQSVRPVPRITIDMGDGRKIERTITGNSIHYVLDAEGNPIDALPGLYGAKTFVADLKEAEAAERTAAGLAGNERDAFLKNYQSNRLATIKAAQAHDLAKVEAQLSAAGKPATDVADTVAALHFDDARLDLTAYNLIYSKESPLEQAMASTVSKCIVETPMMRLVRNLEHSIAEDTVRNEYQLHTQILEWMANGTAPKNLNALNKKIYAELFLTPDSDPWLGLAPADAFSALDKGGLITQ